MIAAVGIGLFFRRPWPWTLSIVLAVVHLTGTVITALLMLLAGNWQDLGWDGYLGRRLVLGLPTDIVMVLYLRSRAPRAFFDCTTASLSRPVRIGFFAALAWLAAGLLGLLH